MSDNKQAAAFKAALSNMSSVKTMTEEQQNEIGQKACEILRSCVESGMYPSLQGKVLFTTDYDIIDDTHIKVNLYFNLGSLYRPSLNPNNAGVYDIVGLLTKGWSIGDEVRMPFARWKGTYITGRRNFQGDNFLLRSGNAAASAISNIDGVQQVSAPWLAMMNV